MKQLKVAIIGQGKSGWSIHGKHFLTDSERFKVVAVVDLIEKRRKKAKEAFGCDVYENYEALFGRKDIDFVVNSTPSHLHVPVTKELLDKGFNVLCEKPLARKVEDVDMLIEASKKSGKLFAIFQQSRYASYFRKVKEVIDSGVLGRIVQISIAFNGFARRWDWQCIQKYNGGNLLNTGPHPLDQALQLFGGSDMPEVKCIMDRTNTYGDAEDYVKLLLTGKCHPVIDIEISSCCAYPSFTYNVQGTRGGLKATMDKAEWKYFIPEENDGHQLIIEPIETAAGEPAYCSEQLKWHEESWDATSESTEVYGTFGFMTGGFYSMLYNTLTKGASLEVTPEQVRRQIAVIEECHRQNPLSQWV